MGYALDHHIWDSANFFCIDAYSTAKKYRTVIPKYKMDTLAQPSADHSTSFMPTRLSPKYGRLVGCPCKIRLTFSIC